MVLITCKSKQNNNFPQEINNDSSKIFACTFCFIFKGLSMTWNRGDNMKKLEKAERRVQGPEEKHE